MQPTQFILYTVLQILGRSLAPPLQPPQLRAPTPPLPPCFIPQFVLGTPQSSVNTLPVIIVPLAFPQLRQPIMPNCPQFCDGLVM